MKELSDGGPAFPIQPRPITEGEENWIMAEGLSKREHFASMALQGWISRLPSELEAWMLTKANGQWRHEAAEMAVECADALLMALEKERKS